MDREILVMLTVILVIICLILPTTAMSREEKLMLKEKSLEMFHHAYNNYMEHAYPADELMPLSCRGRYRGSEPSRGDIDDALGNFSLTLIDSLDTLVILGEVDLFEKAVRNVMRDVSFDNDVVVSVFETNIRVMGGLLGGHLMAEHLRKKLNRLPWYRGELLQLAQDLGNRLLPAFNTSTGMPYPRVNLRYGVKHEFSRTGQEKDTCTACAGTMILEFSALSRLTGNKIYEEKAVRAMNYLWESRHRASDLVGTVINIHNGDWVRRESGVGAGIDSYYEYLLKAYIMLGDDMYLDRFNTHYRAIMKYINNGPLMLDVHMHRPRMNSRNFMDSLLAFWPGLQVLKGDLKSAIEIHEMLYQVTLRHNFLPEAFTSDFRVHWAQHPLRPEFLESTYFIYKATGDPYYLEVGKTVIENLDRLARVQCGFAALKDVTTGVHKDQMDSFVFAETFKYLFLLFSEKEDLIVDVDEYVFTTEAHLLPLFLSMHNPSINKTEEIPKHILDELSEEDEAEFPNTCPSSNHLFKGRMNFAHHLRVPLKNMVENLCPKPLHGQGPRLRAADFIAGNKDQMQTLTRMGIRLITMNDGRVQLLHVAADAASPEDSHDGMLFMQEMIELSKSQARDSVPLEPRVVQLLTPPIFGFVSLKAGPAQFGASLKNGPGIEGQVAMAEPFRACQPITNQAEVAKKFVIVERGDCMFVDKARNIQNAGGIGGIVFDNNSESGGELSPFFSMSGDGKNDIMIPMVFMFSAEARTLRDMLNEHAGLVIYVGEKAKKSDDIIRQYMQAKSSLEKFTKALEALTDEMPDKEEEEEFVRSVKSERLLDKRAVDIITILLQNLRLESLVPWIKSRGSEKVDERLTGACQVRIIRGNGATDQVQVNIEDEEDGQRLVKLVFAEMMLLLHECTNIARLNADLIVGLTPAMDALARLTENVFTKGSMGYGVQTEAVIDSLRQNLVVNDVCRSESDSESSPENKAAKDVSETLAADSELESANEKGSSVEFMKVLDKYIEDQVGQLFKELLMVLATQEKTTVESSTTKPEGPEKEQVEPSSNDQTDEKIVQNNAENSINWANIRTERKIVYMAKKDGTLVRTMKFGQPDDESCSSAESGRMASIIACDGTQCIEIYDEEPEKEIVVDITERLQSQGQEGTRVGVQEGSSGDGVVEGDAERQNQKIRDGDQGVEMEDSNGGCAVEGGRKVDVGAVGDEIIKEIKHKLQSKYMKMYDKQPDNADVEGLGHGFQGCTEDNVEVTEQQPNDEIVFEDEIPFEVHVLNLVNQQEPDHEPNDQLLESDPEDHTVDRQPAGEENVLEYQEGADRNDNIDQNDFDQHDSVDEILSDLSPPSEKRTISGQSVASTSQETHSDSTLQNQFHDRSSDGIETRDEMQIPTDKTQLGPSRVASDLVQSDQVGINIAADDSSQIDPGSDMDPESDIDPGSDPRWNPESSPVPIVSTFSSRPSEVHKGESFSESNLTPDKASSSSQSGDFANDRT